MHEDGADQLNMLVVALETELAMGYGCIGIGSSASGMRAGSQPRAPDLVVAGTGEGFGSGTSRG